jgi:hypothetical protein
MHDTVPLSPALSPSDGEVPGGRVRGTVQCILPASRCIRGRPRSVGIHLLRTHLTPCASLCLARYQHSTKGFPVVESIRSWSGRALGGFLFLGLIAGCSTPRHTDPPPHDLVVYGGTAGGVMAAVQGARMGLSVVLIEPTHRIGGLTSGGLGQTDIGNKRAIGGLARDFYRAVRRHYEDPAAWIWQAREEYRDGGQTRTDPHEDAMWTFEPGVALKILNDFVREAGFPVIHGERLDLEHGVVKRRNRIERIRMESGREFRGRMFIDATYEGDLMALAGVSYTVGREPNVRYGETLNGVQTANARFHQLLPGIDPYVVPGDPSSGLLPGIDPDGPGEEGAGDHRVQAYCFRMCLTDHPENRIPFHRPDGYDELDYELLLRNFEAGERGMPWINSSMPNRKTDTNNRTGFSTDFIGQNYLYPEADYATRADIVRRHLLYQQGLMWTLANHPRVPEAIRREVARWGMTRDEFIEGNGWQDQLYIREARRMIGPIVMTQHHCQGREIVTDPVALGAYGMDSHHVQRHIDASGHVQNEGDVQVGGFLPYPIAYRAITPVESECANLLVPVCLSASHIAFGSIRMEPVFMVLGQSAATAAAHALQERVSVQRVDFPRLEARLRADGQVLEWTPAPGEPARGIHPHRLEGVVVDDSDDAVQRAGFEPTSAVVGPFVGAGYRHDNNTRKGQQWIRFPFHAPDAGRYELRLVYSAHENRATNVPVTITHADGVATRLINQRSAPPIHRMFVSLGVFRFDPASPGTVEIRNDGTDGFVIADAVQFLPVKEP